MRRLTRNALFTLGACGALLSLATTAAAEPGPIKLISQLPSEQAQSAISPAISADGHYVAFQGKLGGEEGVFREDLATGSIALVASMAGSSAEPSISADGRYISFTTSAKLDADDDTNISPDVYVADMSATPPSYELASALDGCDPSVPGGNSCGVTYEGGGGSLASGRVALSANGREVVFVTTGASDLGGTPPGQVYLRNLDTHETTLVSVERDPTTGSMTGSPVPGGAVRLGKRETAGAALSADGTTVAWLGTHIPAQVQLLQDERERISSIDATNDTPYVEPLWRRVADGSQAPTRRIVGGGDPAAPGCPPDGLLTDLQCQGPFPNLTVGKSSSLNAGLSGWLGPNFVDGVPQLSADGREAAVLGNPLGASNLYLVNMAAGLDRKQAVRPLTREISVSVTDPTQGIDAAHIPLNGHVFDLSLSADGNRIVIATARQRFPLAPPTLIGAPPSQVGLVELYMVDLQGETLRRITHGIGGQDEASLGPSSNFGQAAEGVGATSPALSADGRRVAFASTASNLVAGDGNDASDVFTVEDGEGSRAPAALSISPGPKRRHFKRSKRLTLSAVSLPNGDVQLRAIVPSTGALRARASGSLGVDAPPRSLALATKRARKRGGGMVRLRLDLPRRLRRLSHTREGIYAMARVSFRRHGGGVLRGQIQVRFHAHSKHGGGR